LISDAQRYGTVLVLLAASIGVSIIGPPDTGRGLLNTTLQGLAVVVALTGSPAGRAPRAAVFAIVVASILLTAVLSPSLRIVTNLLDALVLVALPLTIGARFRRDLYVSVQSVLGAVCIYLVIGMFFANLDLALSRLTGRPFFAAGAPATDSEYMYFSFVTLATVGYGDLTPGTGMARALAVCEAMTGQLYLVTVIALVVGNFGRARRVGGGTPSSGARDDLVRDDPADQAQQPPPARDQDAAVE
jgi:Ion channel